MARRHYHVGYNMAGYMPEMDVYVVGSKRAAISAVANEARTLNDWCGNDGHDHGSYVKSGGRGDIWLEPRECGGVGGATMHVWYDGPCGCAEGAHMLGCDRCAEGGHCGFKA